MEGHCKKSGITFPKNPRQSLFKTYTQALIVSLACTKLENMTGITGIFSNRNLAFKSVVLLLLTFQLVHFVVAILLPFGAKKIGSELRMWIEK